MDEHPYTSYIIIYIQQNIQFFGTTHGQDVFFWFTRALGVLTMLVVCVELETHHLSFDKQLRKELIGSIVFLQKGTFSFDDIIPTFNFT